MKYALKAVVVGAVAGAIVALTDPLFSALGLPAEGDGAILLGGAWGILVGVVAVASWYLWNRRDLVDY